ncbi:hypothetical protein [Actinacidiphila acidipaludis]|uniref:Uncharacterized protein n=1 Tax=Actinacidiphila acidipaludis TaxID=2873382 RepID=A0ABS7Q4D3_9ACTN|nr:hypothetical protein [Streptomyces acidipaludis]MBY8878019.1 hypothetical protein [Streptomyces acidipaludis]
MTESAALTDACGSAEHVGELLDRFEEDPSGTWSALMDHRCSRLDTAFDAGFAALPRLAAIAQGARRLFGRVPCPGCRTDFAVAECVVARWTP